MKKWLLSLAVALLCAMCLATEPAHAATVDSGKCGDNVTWTLDDSGTLTVSGTGAMADYDYKTGAPWKGYADKITSLVVQQGVTYIGKYACYEYDSLVDIEIAGSVTNIGNVAFALNGSLTGVTIPEGVTTIGAGAFNGCKSLVEVTLPTSLSNIGADAFYSCSALESVYITDLAAWCDIYFDNIQSNPLYHNASLYLNGEKITDMVIPKGVTEIKQYAFVYVDDLVSVTIPEGATVIGFHSFFGCGDLVRVDVPDSLTSIGNNAFYLCERLSDIKIPSGVTSIGSGAFYKCSSLTEVTIPSSLNKIRENVFSSCSSLVSVEISSGVTGIGQGVFGNCTELAAVTIPKSVTSIAAMAFGGCSTLNHVLYTGTQAQWNSISIGENNELAAAKIHYGCTGNEISPVSTACEKAVFYCSICKKNFETARSAHNYVDGVCRYCDKHLIAAPEVTISTKADTGKPYLFWWPVEKAAKYEIYRSATYGGPYTKYHTVTINAYTDIGVKAGEKYYYKVVAVSSAGWISADSNRVTICCDLPNPELTLTNRIVDGKPTLRWSSVSGAVQYEIYRATDYNGPYTKYHTMIGTYFVNTTPQPGQKYYYKVRAISSNPAANSAFSNIEAIYCDLPQPTGVALTTNTATGKPVLTWDAVAGVKEYAIYRSSTYDGPYTKYSTTTSTTFTNSAVQAGQKYYYKVRALSDNTSANGSLSKAATIVCDCAQVQATITLNTSGKPVVKWDTVAGATGYEIWRSTSYDGTYSRYYITESTSFTNSAASAGQQYYYKIRAVVSGNGSATGAFSNIVTIKAK